MTISPLKAVSGLKPTTCQNYDFHDQPWYGSNDPVSAKAHYLCSNCVRISSDFYVFNPTFKSWSHPLPRDAAYAALMQLHMTKLAPISHGGHLLFITEDDIRAFLRTTVVSLHATTYAPGFGDIVIFDNEKRLNTYEDLRMTGDTDHLLDAEEWLKVIRNSLCSAPDEIDFEGMVEEIFSDRKTPFRWVMHWLAARYQIPGFTSGTNLWLIGSLGGVGKGTLVEVMKALMGSSAVGRVNQADVAKGWTNSLEAKQLLEWDEFKDGQGWHSFNRMIKTWTANETIAPNARNRSATLQPAVGMHLFTTNEEMPALVEQHDRRNTMIATTMDQAWPKRAAALRDRLGAFKNPNMVSGFAALLNQIEIDHAFIRSPLETDTRRALKEMSEDSVIAWVKDGALEEISAGFVDGWKRLHDEYCMWNSNATHAKSHDLKTFKKMLLDRGWARETVAKAKMPTGERKSVRRVYLNPPEPLAEAEIELTLHLGGKQA